MGTKVAAATKGKGSKSGSVEKLKLNAKKQCERHAKSKTTYNKRSKNYVKKYKGQGR
jgi:hypothetical protein